MTNHTLPTVALVGLTNVGKSSLFNALLGKTRSVVAYEQHTTRDYIDDTLRLGHRSLHLVDTAGFGTGENLLDASTNASAQIIAQADLVAVVIDATIPVSQFEIELIRKLNTTSKNLILVVHKADKKVRADYQKLGIKSSYFVSSTTKEGIEQLRTALFEHIPKQTISKQALSEIKIALIGRPNVGKSSLLNKLSDSERAIVSTQSGTTRDMITTTIVHNKRTYILADTAGLRRPGKIGRGIERFSASRTTSAIDWADICVLVLDAGELGVHQDLALAGEIIEAGKGLILAVNKVDQLKELDTTRAHLLAKLKSRYQFCYWAPVSLLSAATGINVKKLVDQFEQVHINQTKKLPTTLLNRMLASIIADHPPATTGAGRVKLNYITQTNTTPPTFTIFTNKPSQIHFSYRRYLENKFRTEVDFNGTPIKLVFKDKHT